MLATSAVIFAGVYSDGTFDSRWWLVGLDIAVGIVALFTAALRRRQPLLVAVVTSVLTAVSATAGGPATLALLSLATRRNLRHTAIASAVNLVAASAYVLALSPKPIWRLEEVLGIAVPVVAVVGWGLFIGSNRELMWGLRSRAEHAESEKALRLAEARANERTRIAREMHDVVAHSISQVSMRSGALAFREDLTAEQFRAESAIIRDVANEALNELRSVLAVLRDPSSGAPMEYPQPTFDDLDALVEGARGDGSNTDLDNDLTISIPADVGRTLYRIVQEGITNAIKHAPGLPLRIRLTKHRGGVGLTMANNLGAASQSRIGAGLGLVGVTERVSLAGGTIDVDQSGGEFVVRVWLPVADSERTAQEGRAN